MLWETEKNLPIILLTTKYTQKAGIQLCLKREDLLHSKVSGNKWRKLKYNFEEAKVQKKEQIVTFGGAFSNHILATAAAGNLTQIPTIGVIRGEIIRPLNSTLQAAEDLGMEFHAVSRSDYRDKRALTKRMADLFPKSYIIPEGGTNHLALRGCQEIILTTSMAAEVDYWCVSCGTGGTIAGMIQALPNDAQAIGFSALKGDFLKQEVQDLLGKPSRDNWKIQTDYHFGGYAKFDSSLIAFINDFRRQWQIQLDPIYTGKMMYGVFDLIKKGYFPRGSTVLAVHSGGLQGIAGFNQRFGNIIEQNN